MFILTNMQGNGIQTPSEEQPEPICLRKEHFHPAYYFPCATTVRLSYGYLSYFYRGLQGHAQFF